MGTILIIDDDPTIRDALSRVVGRLGHEAVLAATLADGLRQAGGGQVDVVFLDVRMPDGNGLDAIGAIKAAPSAPEVIVITGWGDPDGAERAMRLGAWDYVEKPPTVGNMTGSLTRAMEARGRERVSFREPFCFEGLAGSSPSRLRCLELAARAADSEVNVLVTGPTGTGKELFARAIHANSARREGPFVVVDCAALPQSIVESVLFGNEKGAYTGADRRREGLIAGAHRGTLFLDEVGEMPLSVQKAFLRVLQERRVRPVGGGAETPCDFRLVAATNQDLRTMVETGAFRQDLLFRLQGMGIELPALGEHPEDVPVFARHFLVAAQGRPGDAVMNLSGEILAVLTGYPWPGNIRELENTMRALATVAADETTLYPEHLPLHIRVHAARKRVIGREGPAFGAPSPAPVFETDRDGERARSFREYRDAAERDYLRGLIERLRGDHRAAREQSGLSRSRFYALLKKHDLA